jgi:hypothetical protein
MVMSSIWGLRQEQCLIQEPMSTEHPKPLSSNSPSIFEQI